MRRRCFVKGVNRRFALPEHQMLSDCHLIKIIYSSSIFKGDVRLDSVPDSPRRRGVCWDKAAFPLRSSATYPVVFLLLKCQKRVRAVSRDERGSWCQSPILMICPVACLSSSISSQRQKTNSVQRGSKCYLKCYHQTELKGLTASSQLQQREGGFVSV